MNINVPTDIKVPVKVEVDGFKFCNELIEKGGIFNCPTEYRADWMETQGTGHRMKRPGDLEAAFPGSWRLIRKKAEPKSTGKLRYQTRQMKAGEESTDAVVENT